MNNRITESWDKRRGVIQTRMGGWVVGEAVYDHGYSLLKDFPGKASFFQVLILHIRGEMPERRLADWMEATFICLSWPDPRIWCNQIGSLAGSARASSIAGVCAGTLASDSMLYAAGTAIPIYDFFVKALDRHYKDKISVEEFIEKECKHNDHLVVPGFIRPLAKGDERVDAMIGLAESLGFQIGPCLDLAFNISEYLAKNYDESINFGGYIVAFLHDHGFTAKEIVRCYSLCVNNGVHACFREAADNPPDAFLPLRCDDVVYEGIGERSVPDLSRAYGGG